MYLGDGSIDQMPRTWRLRVALDLAWPGIVGECAHSMQAVFPRNRILSYQPDPNSRCGVVAVYSKQLVCLFPQHGRGAKHLRPIRLASWQTELVRKQPKQFLRGLICQWPSVSPHARPSVFPTGGHLFSPLAAMGSPHDVGFAVST